MSNIQITNGTLIPAGGGLTISNGTISADKISATIPLLEQLTDMAAKTGVALNDLVQAAANLQNATNPQTDVVKRWDGTRWVPLQAPTAPANPLLRRIAYMAGSLLPAMREAGIDVTHFAQYTALRDALLELQTTQATDMVVGSEDLQDDLVALLDDLSEPPSASPSP